MSREKKEKATNPECLYRSIRGSNKTKDDQNNVSQLLFSCSRNSFVMQHSWVTIAKRNTKIVQIFVNHPSNNTLNTHQAKQPTRATNLSKSAAPSQLRTLQAITMIDLNPFFCHLTQGSTLPLRVNRPFSRILTAGKNWRGTESKMARAYKN